MDSSARVLQLGEVVRFGSGKAIKPGAEGRYQVYGSNGIIGGCDEFRYENGVIIGRVGAYCGSVAYCSEKFWASDNTLVVFPASERFDTKFLFYLLTDAKLSRYAGGAAQPLVTQTVLKQVEVTVPALLVQRRIAGILSAYDELIENNQRRIQILETMARALYREWFVEFRFPGSENVPRVASSLGDIPQGWETKKLGDIIELKYGKALKKTNRRDGEYPVFGSSGIVGYHDKSLVEGPGIIVGRKGNVGSVFWSDEDFFVIDTAYFVTSSVPLRFLFYDLQTKNFINNDAAVPGLNRFHAYALEILAPPLDLIERFCNLADNFEHKAWTLRRQIHNLHRTRDLLLPRLLSGQVALTETAA